MFATNRMTRAMLSNRRICFSSYSPLEAKVRSYDDSGSRQSRSLRSEKQIPGIVYGVDSDGNRMQLMVSVDLFALQKELRQKGKSFENTLYDLTVKGDHGISKYSVVPRQTQFSPMNDMPMSVNFLTYRPGTRLRIPIDFVNADQSQDLKRGSYLVRINQFVECVCDGDVPASISVDLGAAQKGDVFKLKDIVLPPKVRPAKGVPLDTVLCVVKTARSK